MRVSKSGMHIDNPASKVIEWLASFEGVTDNNGNVGGTTIRCGALALEPSYANHALKILSGPAAGQIRDITTHPAGTDTLTVSSAFSNVAGVAQQIMGGTRFVVMSLLPPTAEVAAIEAKLDLPAPNAATNTRIAEVVGNKADAAVGVVGIVASIIAYVKGILNAIAALPLVGIFHEQADVAFNVGAALAEANIFDLSAADTRYVVRSLRVKCVDPGVETVTVRLYELVNNVQTLVDTFDITTANFATAHSLMDMFGLPHLAGDNLKVAVIATAAGPYACTGQFSFALAT